MYINLLAPALGTSTSELAINITFHSNDILTMVWEDRLEAVANIVIIVSW